MIKCTVGSCPMYCIVRSTMRRVKKLFVTVTKDLSLTSVSKETLAGSQAVRSALCILLSLKGRCCTRCDQFYFVKFAALCAHTIRPFSVLAARRKPFRFIRFTSRAKLCLPRPKNERHSLTCEGLYISHGSVLKMHPFLKK